MPGKDPSAETFKGTAQTPKKRSSGVTKQFTPDTVYKVNPDNWYRTFPYSFKFTDRNGEVRTFYLPINPSDMNVTTHFATNIITTLYGVVEEHSEVRYYDIQINGNTGFVPKYVNAVNEGHGITERDDNDFQYWQSSSMIPEITGFGKSGFGTATVHLGGALPQLTNALSTFVDNMNSINGVINKTGVHVDQTGYLAFHNFYRFLMHYKKDASGALGFKRRKQYPFVFQNYKDGVKYDCIITGFNLTRSASNPYMYNYSMSLRCFNMRSLDAIEDVIADESVFGLGNGDIGNIPGFAAISNVVSSASNALGVLAGLF